MNRRAILLTVLVSLLVGCGRLPSQDASDVESGSELPMASTQEKSASFDWKLDNAELKAILPAPEPVVNAIAIELFDGFPKTISLTKAEQFLAKQTISGQACGSMSWEGKRCGMFINYYDSKLNTPWHPSPMSVTPRYAQTEGQNFLVELQLDSQVFRRNARVERELKKHLLASPNKDPN